MPVGACTVAAVLLGVTTTVPTLPWLLGRTAVLVLCTGGVDSVGRGDALPRPGCDTLAHPEPKHWRAGNSAGTGGGLMVTGGGVEVVGGFVVKGGFGGGVGFEVSGVFGDGGGFNAGGMVGGGWAPACADRGNSAKVGKLS